MVEVMNTFVYMTNKNTGDKILCYFTEPTFYLLYWANILSCLNFICICAIFFADIGFRIRWYYGLLVHQCIFNNEKSPCFGNLRTGEYHSKILFKNQCQCLINYFFWGGGWGGYIKNLIFNILCATYPCKIKFLCDTFDVSNKVRTTASCLEHMLPLQWCYIGSNKRTLLYLSIKCMRFET